MNKSLIAAVATAATLLAAGTARAGDVYRTCELAVSTVEISVGFATPPVSCGFAHDKPIAPAVTVRSVPSPVDRSKRPTAARLPGACCRALPFIGRPSL